MWLDKTETYAITNVDFSASKFNVQHLLTQLRNFKSSEIEKLEEPYYLSSYHWLRPGNKKALLFRFYSDQSPLAMDDEVFLKITIVTSTIEPGTYNIDGKSISGFYTRGGSAWPRAQRGNSIENGTLKIIKSDNEKIVAKIDFDIACKSASREITSDCSFHGEHTYKIIAFDKANQWLGKKSEHVYSETYRTLF